MCVEDICSYIRTYVCVSCVHIVCLICGICCICMRIVVSASCGLHPNPPPPSGSRRPRCWTATSAGRRWCTAGGCTIPGPPRPPSLCRISARSTPPACHCWPASRRRCCGVTAPDPGQNALSAVWLRAEMCTNEKIKNPSTNFDV